METQDERYQLLLKMKNDIQKKMQELKMLYAEKERELALLIGSVEMKRFPHDCRYKDVLGSRMCVLCESYDPNVGFLD